MSSALVGIGPTPVEVPPVVHTLAGRLRSGATVVPVWRNEYGGLTVRLEGRGRVPGPDPVGGSARWSDPAHARRLSQLNAAQRSSAEPNTARPSTTRPGTAGTGTARPTTAGPSPVSRNPAKPNGPSSYLKWVPYATACPDPLAEADRLIWAGSFTDVPRVLDVGRDARGSWLLTEAVEVDGAVATSAIEPRWRALAKRSAIAVGVGLRRFHDALPTDTCPFVRTAQMRVTALATDPTAPLAATERAAIRTALGSPPPVDRFVVCHGDATVPNTLLDHVGRFAAHVDVGDLGVADRWSDIAVTTRSVTRRYGPGLEPLVLAAYGVAPDPERTTYYRALWDAEEAVRARRGASS